MSQKKRFSLVPQFERYPWAVRFVQTVPGKFVLLGVFSLLIAIYWPQWVLFVGICLGGCVFFPERRHVLLVVASLASIMIGRTNVHREDIFDLFALFGLKSLANNGFFFVLIILVLFLCYLTVLFSKKPKTGNRVYLRRPILAVLAVVFGVAITLSYAPVAPAVKGLGWALLIIFNKYIWFLAYSLCERNAPDSPPFHRQLGYYLPFWYPVNLPIPKGASYIGQIRADSPEALAVCQLKGLKLLIWAIYLSIFAIFLKAVCLGFGESYSKLFALVVDQKTLLFFFREQLVGRLENWPLILNIPNYNEAVELCSAGQPLPFYRNWQALILKFFLILLHIAILSHGAIAICRMAGYRALRNVHKPFSATTLAGFWNNYQYYYKELMVAVFFYPTFLRCFRNRPILRYFTATMAAAGLGNFIYHLFVKIDLIVNLGFFEAVFAMQSLALYCFLLATGIFLSQLRKLRRGKNSRSLPRPLATAGVLLFYCIILIFGETDKLYPVTDNFKFLLSLFNIG